MASLMVIEDDLDIAEIFRTVFQKARFEVEVIHNGEQALQRLQEITPDVILLDLRLPRVSGMDLYDYIVADDRLHSSYLIVTSADPRLAASYRNRANLVLVKPVVYSELIDLARDIKAALGDD